MDMNVDPLNINPFVWIDIEFIQQQHSLALFSSQPVSVLYKNSSESIIKLNYVLVVSQKLI